MRPYTKLNSQGNDFILTESDTTMPDISVANIIKYSSRDNIGCDQFFIIDTTDKKNIFCKVYNQDGSKACQCGNGLRATMLFLNRKYDILKTNLIVCGVSYEANIYDDKISINMGSPKYVNILKSSDDIDYTITQRDLVVSIISVKDNIKFSFIPLSIGNSHCIVFSEKCNNYKDQISRYFQNNFKVHPKYHTEKVGESNNFTCKIYRIEDGREIYVCSGIGESKKKSEQDASKKALVHFNVLT